MCRECGMRYARSPKRPDIFCGEKCRDLFMEKRADAGLCAHPECRRSINQANRRLRRKYCSDTCCSKSYYDRTGGFMLRRMVDRRSRPREDRVAARVAARAAQIGKDRARSRVEYRKRQEFDPFAPTAREPYQAPPQKHVPQNTYRPGLIAFALLYGYQSTGATVLASCPGVSEARAVRHRNRGAP